MSQVMKSEKTSKVVSNKVYTSAEKNKILEKLTTARIGLLLRHPFFGNMATRMKLIDASDWCPTLATDGRNFYYSNAFVDKLSTKEAEFGFAHEVMHNIFDHMGRREGRHPMLSNIAADYAANQILIDEKIGAKPSFIKIFQDDKYRDWSYEAIYNDIYEKAEKIDISKLGELLDDHLDQDDEDGGNGKKPKLTPEERKAIRDEIKEAMIASAQSCSAGKMPKGISRLIKDLTEPKMDWREILRMNILSIIKSNFSFNKPNRKSQHTGAVLPGLLNDETIDICVGIDMSGSISDAQGKDFLSEIKGIIDQYTDYKITVWSFDTQVYNQQEFTPDNGEDIAEYELKGGGGTDFMANWEYMKDHDIQPKKFIMFTDGYPCGDWGDEDYCDTLFVIHGNETIVAPFGQTTYYK